MGSRRAADDEGSKPARVVMTAALGRMDEFRLHAGPGHAPA